MMMDTRQEHHTGRGEPRRLERMGDYKLAHSSQDVRGHDLKTDDGRKIGRIDNMLVDRDREEVYALELEDGRLVNVDYVDIRGHDAYLLVPDDSLPKSNIRARDARTDRDSEDLTTAHVPEVEERVKIGKREKDYGGIKVHKSVHTDVVEEDLALRRERVDVERHDVSGRNVSPGKDAFKEETIEVHAHGEEPVVQKEAVVTGEVEINKHTDVEHEKVREKARRTEVDVEDNRTAPKKRS
jgi:stress response protein YsnF